MNSLSQITAIAQDAARHDGVAPLDEAALLTLAHHPESVRSWTRPEGFALLIDQDVAVVVRPEARRAGIGTALLAELLADAGDGPLSAWSHGDHPGAAALAAATGFHRARELWVMRRPAAELPPMPATPAGVELRGFRPDDPHDTAELLRVNAAAFAHHPEQGDLDAAGLAERMAEPWFDPAGLVLATEGDRVLAFHWTKRHSDTEGEVYVVGVDPTAQGRGLGTVVTLAGLHHLASASGNRPGVGAIHLYVEADNEPAVRLYGGLGFTRATADTHVQYARR